MKKFSISLVFALSYVMVYSQQAQLTLQPDSICGKDALIWNALPFNNGNTNYGTLDVMGAHAWTNTGVPDTGRTLIQFDLSAIPVGSVISSAYLSLYNNPTTTYFSGQHSTMSGVMIYMCSALLHHGMKIQ